MKLKKMIKIIAPIIFILFTIIFLENCAPLPPLTSWEQLREDEEDQLERRYINEEISEEERDLEQLKIDERVEEQEEKETRTAEEDNTTREGKTIDILVDHMAEDFSRKNGKPVPNGWKEQRRKEEIARRRSQREKERDVRKKERDVRRTEITNRQVMMANEAANEEAEEMASEAAYRAMIEALEGGSGGD